MEKVKERIDLLADSFNEMDALVKDGVITGHCTINSRPAYLAAQDFSHMGGSLGKMHANKIAKVLELAIKTGTPFIFLNESGGARIQEGIDSLDGYAKIFKLQTMASGIIPQISVILGSCAGGAVYSPALTDFIVMVRGSNMFITGPDVIESVTGETTSHDKLGGAAVHSSKSGVAHFIANDEKECFDLVKKLLTYLPQNNMKNPATVYTGDSSTREVNIEIPAESKKTYDIKTIINEIVDKDSFFEVHASFALNVVTGFARLGNVSIGIVANQPYMLAGCIDINASDKIARFVRTCDCFNIPVINLVDVPGFLPGLRQEHRGIIRDGAKVLYAYAEATVPKISLILRKAYGGAYISLCSKELGFDATFALPTAEIAVMGSEQAVNIIHKKESDEVKKQKQREYEDEHLNLKKTAESGKIDNIIEPKDTRKVLVRTLRSVINKREKRLPKKHGNIPL